MPTSITNPTFQRAVMDSATATGATFDGALLGLTKSLVNPGKLNVAATYTAVEADYNTYARAAQTWAAAHSLPDGLVRAVGSLSEFALANTLVTESIYSAFLLDTAGTGLLAGGSLATPAPLSNLDQGLLLVPCIPWLPSLLLSSGPLDLLTTSHCDRLVLNGLTGMTGVLHNAKAHLIKSAIPITPGTTLAALAAVEADYSGYASQTISTWSAAFVDSTGRAQVGGTDLLWQPTSSTVVNTVYGVYVTDSTSATLFFAYLLDSPVALTSLDTGFRDAPTLSAGT